MVDDMVCWRLGIVFTEKDLEEKNCSSIFVARGV